MLNDIDLKNSIYFTDEIIYLKKKLYYINNNKLYQIKKKNWIKYFKKNGWELLNYKNNKIYGNPLGYLECGGDGNCFFYSVIEALNNPLNKNEDLYTFNDIKNLIANQINKDNYKIIIDLYKIQKKQDFFFDNWDPEEVNNLEDLRNVFKNLGKDFWADHITIDLLQDAISTNIHILYLDEHNNLLKYQTMNNLNYKKNIFLLYVDEIHFQLIGCFYNNSFETLFTNNIPKILKELI